MHVRQQIRNAITAKIKEVTEFGDNVFESRVYPLNDSNIPAALIFSETEVVESATRQKRPGIQRRIIETGVYLFAKADYDLEDKLDPLAAKVELAIFDDATLGGIAENTELGDTSLLIGGDPDAPIGAARLSFISTVLTQQGDPETPLQLNGGIFK